MNIINRSILWSGLMTFSLININNVNAQTCAIPPSCEALGYTMKLSDCEKFDHLKCPFDMSKVYCNKKPEPLELGDQVFSGDVFDILEKEGFKIVSTVQLVSESFDRITHAKCKQACSDLRAPLLPSVMVDVNLPTIAEVIKLDKYKAPGKTKTYLDDSFSSPANMHTTGGCIRFSSNQNKCPVDDGNCLCVTHYTFQLNKVD